MAQEALRMLIFDMGAFQLESSRLGFFPSPCNQYEGGRASIALVLSHSSSLHVMVGGGDADRRTDGSKQPFPLERKMLKKISLRIKV